MAEQPKKTDTTTPVPAPTPVKDAGMYLDKINQLKQQLDAKVDPEEHNRVIIENKKLLDALVNGKQIEVADKGEADLIHAKAIINSLAGTYSNLDTWKARRTIAEHRHPEEPWLDFLPPNGWKSSDAEKAEQVWEALCQSEQQAHGSPDAFNGIFAGCIREGR